MGQELIQYDQDKSTLPRLVKYEQLEKMIAECDKIDEVKQFLDQAVALKWYGRQSKNHEIERHGEAIRKRAERRMGQMLKKIEREITRFLRNARKNATCINPSVIPFVKEK